MRKFERSDREKEKEEILKSIAYIVTAAAEPLGLQLVDVEYLQDGGYWYVRIYVEYPDRDISLEDCALLSGKVEEDIDRIVDRKFFLEVSSPGLERPLKKTEDFLRFQGEKAKVSLKHKSGETKSLEGKIVSCDADCLILDMGKETLTIPRNEIRKANLVFDFGALDQ
ncbi:MAG: ribosome maturation factor RimP [Fusobacteriaceae bacterium]|jgi:ribosome maturation factor RimP|nr:ribosome maturation factor RimP [Fusobacteriaceae bacterium]